MTSYWRDTDWDHLTLGDTQLPGVWEVDGTVERRVDVKTQRGSDGANIKDQGYENADLTLLGRLHSREEWQALLAALKKIHPRRKGAGRDPMALVHPSAAALGIDMVYVTGIETPQLDNGILEVRIRCLEWIPKPKPKKKKKPVPIKGSQERANWRWSNEHIRGLETTTTTGEKKVDLGFPPPRDSSTEFLEENHLSQLQLGEP